MKNLLIKIRYISARISIGLILAALLYFFCAFTLPNIQVNKQNSQIKSDSVCIYVISNGVHTDIAVPCENFIKNWQLIFPKDSFKLNDYSSSYLAFGWGDKGFYLETPEWSDLKASTAFKAAFGLGGSAMHVRYLNPPKKLSDKKIALNISSEQYKKLINYIEQSLCFTNGCITKINHPGYGDSDLFYEANGKYSLIKTCNVWTNKALKHSGIKTGFWTPFADGLMRSLR